MAVAVDRLQGVEDGVVAALRRVAAEPIAPPAGAAPPTPPTPLTCDFSFIFDIGELEASSATATPVALSFAPGTVGDRAMSRFSATPATRPGATPVEPTASSVNEGPAPVSASADRYAQAPMTPRSQTTGSLGGDSDPEKLAEQNYREGMKRFEARDLMGAIALFREAVRQVPSKATYHFQLGTALATNPRWAKEAEKHLLEATRDRG